MPYTTYPTTGDERYSVRQSVNLGLMTGNGAVSKFVTFANSVFFSLSVWMDTIGTSTYSSTTSAQTVSLYVVANTSTTTTVGLTTSTWGPYVVGGAGTVSQAGGTDIIVLNTNTGSAAYGGVSVPAYSEVYCQLGTDATAKVVATLDYRLAGGAAIVA
jgi:hypothetical protein